MLSRLLLVDLDGVDWLDVVVAVAEDVDVGGRSAVVDKGVGVVVAHHHLLLWSVREGSGDGGDERFGR
jgi:putative NIF3 family GTP cyclohydrolase 1 type 2